MDIYLHQTHHTIGDFNSLFNYLEKNVNPKAGQLHLFPELFLTGYPLQDLCLQQSFIKNYHQFLEKLNHLFQSFPLQEDCLLLMGGLEYLWKGEELVGIKNVIFRLSPGKTLQPIYTKKLLPNYDIFDENKYFISGHEKGVLEWQGLRIGLLICEDMWPSPHYSQNPFEDLKLIHQEKKLDLIVDLSASPYYVGKEEQRFRYATTFSQKLKIPFFYVNRVGGEDELLFDGQSFIINQDQLIMKAKSFQEDILVTPFPLTPVAKNSRQFPPHFIINSFPSTLRPQAPLLTSSKPPQLPKWSHEQCQQAILGLQFGIQEYAEKNRFNHFLVALSGGMDSALVVTLLALSLKKGQTLEAIYMPSKYSSELSFRLSENLCANLNIPLLYLPIKFLHSTLSQTLKSSWSEEPLPLVDENMQARLRGLLLYARSNQKNSLVINTSNRSELAVGYSTQYGDSVGAISMLGDLYKTQVYHLAKFINETLNGIIPEEIIKRPPSAELRPLQTDQDSLPPYERLDAILEIILNYTADRDKIVEWGFSAEEVDKIFRLYCISEYKRYQFCPIIKMQMKSFGFGYRNPISKSFSFYQE